MVYIANYLDMHGFLAVGYFAEKQIRVSPYFQYFSSRLGTVPIFYGLHIYTNQCGKTID